MKIYKRNTEEVILDTGDSNSLLGFDFSGMNLFEADFSYKNLTGANFSGANVSWCDFRYAILNKADFSNVNAICTVFSYADMQDANLTNADLRCSLLDNAMLWDADFKGAIVVGSHINSADLTSAKNIYRLYIDPREIVICGNYMQFGYNEKAYTIEEWRNLTTEEILKLDDGRQEWNKFAEYYLKWKDVIFSIIDKGDLK